MKHVFGPVPSRRLGRSLGVDLVPFKTCTYDCIYCQLGLTTNRTISRQVWVPLQEVLDELRVGLASEPEYITLSGSGEPTLYLGLDELIGRIHDLTDTPVAVLTNGSLLWQPAVRAELSGADLVIPSLDCGGENTFQSVNRPHQELTFELLVDGLVAFRKEFTGEYWLEIMLLGGYTSTIAEVKRIAAMVEKIAPDKIQLNTVTRPPAEKFASGIEYNYLQQLATHFARPVEIIVDSTGSHHAPEFSVTRETLLQLLNRRPCSVDDITAGLGIHRNEAAKHLEELIRRQKINYRMSGGKLYYVATGAIEQEGQ